MQTVAVLGSTYDAYESISVSSTAVILTVATYGPRPYAFITVETAPIRFRLDGTAPTATEGHLAEPGDVIHLRNHDQLQDFQAIRTGADAVIKCSYGNTSKRT